MWFDSSLRKEERNEKCVRLTGCNIDGWIWKEIRRWNCEKGDRWIGLRNLDDFKVISLEIWGKKKKDRETRNRMDEYEKMVERDRREWKNGKLEEKKEKKGNAWMKKKGYMIMNLWGKWDDIKWYWDEYLDLLVVSENRNNGQIGIDGW